MKLEVGQFARTKLGTIGKIENNSFYIKLRLKKGNYIIIEDDDVVKASYNIIDILEVGDYVNGYKVSAIYNPNGDEIVNITLIMEYGYETINTYIDDYSINSIVTKEQFEQTAYRVEE